MILKSILRLPVIAILVLAVTLTACTPVTPAPDPATAQPTAAAAATSPAATAGAATAAATATVAATNTAAPAATIEPTATAAATQVARDDQPPTGDAAFDFLVEVSKAQLEQEAWRATVTSDDGTTETTTIIEFVRPGSFHIVAGEETEIIIIPDEGTFLKEGETWQKSPIDMSGMMSEFLTQQNIEESLKQANVTELKYEGTETLDGRRMWVYTYKSAIKSGEIAVDTDTKLWLGVENKLPYRYETTSGTEEPVATNVIVYEYDPGITIEAPEVAS